MGPNRSLRARGCERKVGWRAGLHQRRGKPVAHAAATSAALGWPGQRRFLEQHRDRLERKAVAGRELIRASPQLALRKVVRLQKQRHKDRVRRYVLTPQQHASLAVAHVHLFDGDIMAPLAGRRCHRDRQIMMRATARWTA